MIQLSARTKKKIEEHGQRAYPNECCGFLFGREENDRVIMKSIEVENTHEEDQRRRFKISPSDYLNAEKFADEHDLDFLGIYHSHPDHPSLPSEHDRKQAMPYFSYFILSVKEGRPDKLQSWRLDESFQFDEEEINIKNQ